MVSLTFKGARHEGALIPGKLIPSHNVAYIPFGGGEHPHTSYEVLCGCNPQWIPVTGGGIPPQAVPAGESESGEPLFVGRVHHEGSITTGKVQVRISIYIHNCIYAYNIC